MNNDTWPNASVDHQKSNRRRRLPAILCGLALLFAPAFLYTLHAQNPPPGQPEFHPSRILVKPKRGLDLQLWHQLQGARVLRSYPRIGGLQTVQLPPGARVADFLALYRQSGLVEYAEPDRVLHVLATPDDPGFLDGSLWGLHNTGQLGGKPDADIDAPEAWDARASAESIIVAVIDTGIRATHEDLAANMWVNPGESGPGTLGLDKSGNLIDDDGNGYTDDVHGIDASIGIGSPFDDHGHGTHVAGTIGAVGNNAVGSVGVAWNVRLMACKFLNAAGQGFTSDAIECIDYARANGARIINASWGGYGEGSPALRDAIASTRDAGILFVAAAGNDATDNDAEPLFPAAYDLNNILAVAATDRHDRLASFSNFGKTSVDLGAPGEDIFSCWNLGDASYRLISGTSMATPHVVGAAALAWAHHPGDSHLQVRDRVLASVDPLPGLTGRSVSEGRLNLQKLLGSATPSPENSPVSAGFTANPSSGPAPLTVQFTDQSTGPVASRAWNFGDGSSPDSQAHTAHLYNSEGQFTVTLTVTGNDGSTDTTSRIVSVSGRPRLGLPLPPVLLDEDGTPLDDGDAGPLQLTLEGEPGRTYLIQASTDLEHWVTVATNRTADTGSVLFNDPRADRYSQRFYRAVLEDSASPEILGYRADRILFKPKTGLTLSVPNLLLGASIQRAFPRLGNLQVINLPEGMPVKDAMAAIQATGNAEYVEPDYKLKLLATPNDFRFNDGTLWGLHNTGQLGGTDDADIDAPEAWDIRTGADGVVVAVIDTGVRYTHEDLAANMWVNPNEVPGNGLDDDGNGYVDDVHGINAILRNGDPDDDHGHGSHVAGSIGAVGNNEAGVVGVAWDVRLMACKFINAQGDGSISDAIASIEYARENGAGVISASWGSSAFDSAALRDAFTAARDAGIIFAAAAGNSARDNDVEPLYPASYDHDNIISVAATTRTDHLAFFSHWGASSVDLGAPGQNIFSCWIDSDSSYQFFDGTSMAAAHVAGAMAILKAHYPGESHQQLINRVLSGTDPVPALDGITVTGGRLNLQQALGVTPPSITVTVAASDPDASEDGPDPGEFTLTRSGGTSGSLVVNFSLGGSASNGGDYETLPTSVTIPDGAASTTLTVTPVDDTGVEGDESVILTLSPGPGYTVGSPNNATVTLADNDEQSPPPQPVVTVTASDPDASEAGPDAGEFTVSRDGDTSGTLDVHYSLGGSAQNGVDYDELSGSVTIPAGAAAATIIVTPVQDAEVEGNETVVLTLSAGDAYTAGSPGSATITITDSEAGTPPADEPVLTLEELDPDASETGPDAGIIQFHRTGDPNQPITVHWTFSGTAENGTDFEELPTTSEFPAGLSSAELTLMPIDDSEVEGIETIIVTLVDGPGYSVGSPDTATVTIADNDEQTPPPSQPVVTVTASDPDAAEEGSEAGEFTFTRDGDTEGSLTVRYTLAGTATKWNDYRRLEGDMPEFVIFQSGESSATLVIHAVDDNEVEGDETVVLTLLEDESYQVGSPDTATMTIADNDEQAPPPTRPTVTIAAGDPEAAEAGEDPGEFTLHRDGNTDDVLTVQYTLEGTAENGADYQTLSGSVTIAAGSATTAVAVRPIDDSDVEGDETVILQLTTHESYEVGTPDRATVAIADNDQPPQDRPTVTVASSVPAAAELGPITGEFTVSRSGDTTAPLTVHYELGGTAENGTDYEPIPDSVTIPGGSRSASILVTPLQDTHVEVAETVVLTLVEEDAYGVGIPDTAAVVIADDDIVPVIVTATIPLAAELGLVEGGFTIARVGDTASGPLTVHYTLGGKATNGTDYQRLPESVTIPAGELTTTLRVVPIDDADSEGNENVFLTIEPEPGYEVGVPDRATVQIVDDDPPLTIILD